MENIKTIKGVSREVWIRFKELAVKKSMKMGDLLENMVSEYEKNAEDIWNIILDSGKILSDKEADDLKKITVKLRKGKGFRNALDF